MLSSMNKFTKWLKNTHTARFNRLHRLIYVTIETVARANVVAMSRLNLVLTVVENMLISWEYNWYFVNESLLIPFGLLELRLTRKRHENRLYIHTFLQGDLVSQWIDYNTHIKSNQKLVFVKLHNPIFSTTDLAFQQMTH